MRRGRYQVVRLVSGCRPNWLMRQPCPSLAGTTAATGERRCPYPWYGPPLAAARLVSERAPAWAPHHLRETRTSDTEANLRPLGISRQ